MIPTGILVIKNISGYNNPQIPYTAPYPFKDVWKKYRGIGGEIGWPDIDNPKPPLINGLASFSSFMSCYKFWEKAKKKYPRDKINLLAIGEVEKCDDLRFIFLGYDCGFISEFDNFSAISDDLIFRNFFELEPFRRLLNKNMLFSTFIEANIFLEKRKKLLEQSYPLETDDNEFSPIPIFSIKWDMFPRAPK